MAGEGRANEEAEEGARDDDGREHADDDAEAKGEREAFDDAGAELVAEPPEDAGGHERGDVAVAD